MNAENTKLSLRAAGEQAPDFNARAQGRDVSLAAVRGRSRAAVLFYPLAFTPVCRAEMPELQRCAAQFAERHCAIFAISVDHQASANAFAEFCGVTAFPVIGDWSKTIVTAYGVLREEGFAERASFLVDRAGIIRFVQRSELMLKRDFSELLPQLDRID
jgi:peroxiredoxin (alkyl hydroperoxide reductase subunit C)